MKILCLGDVFSEKGTFYAKKNILNLENKHEFSAHIINIENSAKDGKGPCENAYNALNSFKNTIFTGGNHSFANKYFLDKYSIYKNCIRPCNFPKEVPGSGYHIIDLNKNLKLAVINVQLRTFMREQLSCPFRAVESILTFIKSNNENILIFIDVHGEATAEKLTFANYFDGKVTAIFGTHTHVQTSDARILPKGTAYITDLGMNGALNSSIGIKFESTTHNFLTQLPTKFLVEENGPFISSGIIVEIDEKIAKAKKITLVNEIF